MHEGQRKEIGVIAVYFSANNAFLAAQCTSPCFHLQVMQLLCKHEMERLPGNYFFIKQ